jgi:hypothetical protein
MIFLNISVKNTPLSREASMQSFMKFIHVRASCRPSEMARAFALQYLSLGILGQGVDELHGFGPLESRKVFLQYFMMSSSVTVRPSLITTTACTFSTQTGSGFL